MALKSLLSSLDGVPEHVKPLYKKLDDGSYQLDLDDSDLTAKINEFRTNNRTMHQQLQQLESKMKQYEGIDPTKYQEYAKLAEQIEKTNEAELLKSGKFDEVISKRLNAALAGEKANYEKQLAQYKAYEQSSKDYRDKYNQLRLETEVMQMVAANGIPRPGAMNDILNRARLTWITDEKDNFAAPDVLDEKGRPVTLEGWVKNLVTEAPYLFESSGGSGASGGRRNDAGQRTIKIVDKTNPLEFGKNLEALATGEAEAR